MIAGTPATEVDSLEFRSQGTCDSIATADPRTLEVMGYTSYWALLCEEDLFEFGPGTGIRPGSSNKRSPNFATLGDHVLVC